jgi:hypothetical protein
MVIAFRPDTDNRTTRVRVVVPDAVRDLLERTYEDQTVGELPYDNQADADELLRLFRVHSNRRNLRLHTEYTQDGEGRALLRFKMRDKRVYTKRSPRWHQASA